MLKHVVLLRLSNKPFLFKNVQVILGRTCIWQPKSRGPKVIHLGVTMGHRPQAARFWRSMGMKSCSIKTPLVFMILFFKNGFNDIYIYNSFKDGFHDIMFFNGFHDITLSWWCYVKHYKNQYQPASIKMASNIHRSPTLRQPSKTSIASQVSSLKPPSWGVQRWDPTRAHSHSWLFLSSPGGWSDFITAVSHGHFSEWLSNPLRTGSCKSQDWVIPLCWLDSMSYQ
jgi:hypothetical protein